MEKEFVPYEQALELKELGFDEPCLAFSYTKSEFGYIKHKLYLVDSFEELIKNSDKDYYYARPTWQQVFRFFREKYGLHYITCKNIQMDGYGYREVILLPYMEENENTVFKTYEKAELECLKKLIEIVKNGRN